MNQLVELLRDKILEQEKNQHDYRKANKLSDEIHQIFRKLRHDNQLGDLRPLLSHDSIGVVSTVATYYLLEDESVAKEAFKRLKSRDNFDSFVIDNTLEQWKKGELNFDY